MKRNKFDFLLPELAELGAVAAGAAMDERVNSPKRARVDESPNVVEYQL